MFGNETNPQFSTSAFGLFSLMMASTTACRSIAFQVGLGAEVGRVAHQDGLVLAPGLELERVSRERKTGEHLLLEVGPRVVGEGREGGLLEEPLERPAEQVGPVHVHRPESD